MKAFLLTISTFFKKINTVFFSFLSRLFFAKHILVILDGRIIAVDTAISQAVYMYRTPWLTRTMHIISMFGQEYLYFIGMIIGVFLIFTRNSSDAVTFLSTFLIGALMAAIIKRIILRPRPMLAPLITLRSYSFPSGHSMTAFVFYTLCSYLLFVYISNLLVAALGVFICYILVLLVGLSRVYLGVHYPSDVVAGYFFGAIVTVTMVALFTIVL